ncbi:BTAD domain-containing putative transcriptional regulator [Streptomyces sp. NPDC058773]|uniref:AfsR/SARP family transcriptional regulator n=1 Tax=Streptomyces sp. NPDC058773 TaxID=3346632 RepID=UPI0036BBA731
MFSEGSSSVHYAILGPLRLVVNGEPRTIRSRNLSIILTTLLVKAGSIVTVDDLIGEVWAQPPARARDAIYVHISKLRQQLGDKSQGEVIWSQFPGYLMNLHGEQLDLQLFHRHRIDGHRDMVNGDYRSAARDWKSGLSLCRGTLLGGAYSGPILGGFDSWLQQSRADCIELTAWSQLSAGLCHEAIDFLSLHLMQHPLNEILYQQLMLAFFLSRHRAQSLRVFHRACRTLADELGINPGGDLRMTQDIVLADDIARAKRAITTAVASRVSDLQPPAELPRHPHFVG